MLAYQTLKEERGKLVEYGKILHEAEIIKPLACYKKVGKPIEPSDKPAKTEDDFKYDPYIDSEEKDPEDDGKDDEPEEDDDEGSGVERSDLQNKDDDTNSK